MRDDKYLHEGVFSLRRSPISTLRVQSEGQRIFFMSPGSSSRGYGVADDLPLFYPRYTGCRGITVNQTTWLTWPACIWRFYVQRFLRGSMRRRYVKSVLTALLKQPSHFYKFRTTLYSFLMVSSMQTTAAKKSWRSALTNIKR